MGSQHMVHSMIFLTFQQCPLAATTDLTHPSRSIQEKTFLSNNVFKTIDIWWWRRIEWALIWALVQQTSHSWLLRNFNKIVTSLRADQQVIEALRTLGNWPKLLRDPLGSGILFEKWMKYPLYRILRPAHLKEVGLSQNQETMTLQNLTTLDLLQLIVYKGLHE